MRIGLVADCHVGYQRGTRQTADGVNVREQDVIDSARRAIQNLLDAGVDAIVDAGDLAHVPAPKKRAVKSLIEIINSADPVPFFSVNGNHTLTRSNADIHLYELLESQCFNFKGYTDPTYIEYVGAYVIPYLPSVDIVRALEEMPTETQIVVGHWACDDVPFPGDHVRVRDLPDVPVFLGHYHKRKAEDYYPVYLGATDRFAWGEWNNPTGAAIFDTDAKSIEFIDHPVREWVDIQATPENYLEGTHYAKIKDAIIRITIDASPEEYQSLDLVRLRKKLSSALEFQVRRGSSGEVGGTESTGPVSISLIDSWTKHIASVRLPRGVQRKEVERIGREMLHGSSN